MRFSDSWERAPTALQRRHTVQTLCSYSPLLSHNLGTEGLEDQASWCLGIFWCFSEEFVCLWERSGFNKSLYESQTIKMLGAHKYVAWLLKFFPTFHVIKDWDVRMAKLNGRESYSSEGRSLVRRQHVPNSTFPRSVQPLPSSSDTSQSNGLIPGHEQVHVFSITFLRSQNHVVKMVHFHALTNSKT